MLPAGLRYLAVLIVLLLTACAGPKTAQRPDVLPAAARQHLAQGVRLAQQQQPAAAILHFEAARKHAPRHPPLLLNLGLAHSQLRQHAAAAGWLNAWLATGAPSPQQAAIEQHYAREHTAALASTTAILRQSVQELFLRMQTLPRPEPEYPVMQLATNMAGGGDIYGALRLLAETDRLLTRDAHHPPWLQTARDSAWEAYALSLVFTRQPVLADQARHNIRHLHTRQRFWWQLAENPAAVFGARHAQLPGGRTWGLESSIGWIVPLALQYETPPGQHQHLRQQVSAQPARHARPDLQERTLQLAVATSRMNSRMVTTDTRLLTGEACALNTLLFYMQATALERRTASP